MALIITQLKGATQCGKAPAHAIAMALLIGCAMTASQAKAADPSHATSNGTATRSTPRTDPALNATEPSDPCTELGSAARAVAAWRDAGGAAWMAKAKLDQHIAEPTVRDAAQQLVDTLYAPTMRKLGPDETALAVAQSCMDAKSSSSVTPPNMAN